ncbi:allantoicase [Blastococcus sp. URHD0036]|uniref:allantoicase n=1 Tax=Blastococcus sp. URHD0036 TaxID=1380356 RepID=UPI000495D133|nr:allantoicase [Blastococcus sp. URHD0036]
MSDPSGLPDLARRDLGGAVVAANDEFFAAKENLIVPGPAQARVEFGHRGKEYDGWETRRRREPGSDWAIVRLGMPGVVSAVVIDTAYFLGNFPPQASVEGAAIEGYPPASELAGADWFPLLPLAELTGGTANTFAVESGRRVTHVRLSIHPDGGVARFRVHGTVVPDPRLLDAGPVDLAALENGGLVTAVSNAFYGTPHQLLGRGVARSMGEGWETARRRDDGNDWVDVALACEGSVTLAELDTSYFLGNAPGAAALTGTTADGRRVELLPRTPLQPDTRHRFVLPGDTAVSSVRLDVFPDGGMARLRLWGRPSDSGRAALHRRWAETAG